MGGRTCLRVCWARCYAPATSASPEFTPTEVPVRIADLAFSYLRPANFHVVQIPDERPDFDQPTSFFPLQVVMANFGAILFSAVARPAYADGLVQDWAEFLARESKLEIVSLRPAVLALADDAASLDPELPFNVRLRDNGAGLTPRVLESNSAEKYAVIGAGALVATFKLPFGWHAIDDGKRTLVFDSGGKVQISLNLRRDDGDARALLAQARAEQPEIDPLPVDFAADLPGLVLRSYRDGEDVLVQAFLVKHLRDDGLAHVARVTASPDDMSRAMNLVEIILRSLGVPVAAS